MTPTAPARSSSRSSIAFSFLLGLFALARWGARLVKPFIATGDSELTVIMIVGFGVFVAGFAHYAGASDAVGALLAGMVVAGTGIGPRVEKLLIPLRDVFAAIFFFWFGLTIAPSDMGAIAPAVIVAVVVTLLFNVIAGIVAARIYGYGATEASNTALKLVSRGEFELILAALAVAAGLDGRVAPFAAFYVLVLSILSPLMSARSQVLARWLPDRWFSPQTRRERGAEHEHSEPLIEVGAIRRLGAETVEFDVRREHAILGGHVRDLGLPRDALVSVIVRGGEAIAPRGSTTIHNGDRLHVLVRHEVAREVEALQERWRSGPMGLPPRPRRKLRGTPPIFTVRPIDERAVIGDLTDPSGCSASPSSRGCGSAATGPGRSSRSRTAATVTGPLLIAGHGGVRLRHPRDGPTRTTTRRYEESSRHCDNRRPRASDARNADEPSQGMPRRRCCRPHDRRGVASGSASTVLRRRPRWRRGACRGRVRGPAAAEVSA